MVDFKKKFLEEWNKLDVSNHDLTAWKYGGGNRGRHYNYWKILFPNTELPESDFECVCLHHIQENCYIYLPNTDEIVILGNCCIKKFIPTCNRSCEVCGDTHKSRNDNRCKNCKIKKNVNKTKFTSFTIEPFLYCDPDCNCDGTTIYKGMKCLFVEKKYKIVSI